MKQVLTVYLEDAAKVIAQLVREGVTFQARQDPSNSTLVQITFTGGW